MRAWGIGWESWDSEFIVNCCTFPVGTPAATFNSGAGKEGRKVMRRDSLEGAKTRSNLGFRGQD